MPTRNRYHRTRSKRAVRISLVIILAFFLVEAIGGWWTHSLALLADAGHLLTDVGALAMTLMAFWFAARPVTVARTYGYYRVEILAALANGLALWAVAAYILFEAYQRLLDPPEVLGGPMVLIASAGFVAQLAAARILHRAADQSLNTRSAFLHVATDAVQSAGIVLAGVLMLLFGWYVADPIVSAVISVLIIYTGGRIVFQATNVLLEGTPSDVDIVALEEILRQADGVVSVHDIHTWSITSGYNALSAHAVLADGVTPEQGQRILVQLRDAASGQFGISHVTIQLEGGSLECQEDHVLASQRSTSSRSDR
jgi:cobalt-zinc-cadmium efflux system protein